MQKLYVAGLQFKKRKFLDAVFVIAKKILDTRSERQNDPKSDPKTPLKQKYRPNLPSIEVIFVSSGYMQKLNKKSRNKDYPTDVLAFYSEYLSSIVLCISKIKECNPTMHISSAMYKTFIHGLLHIYGYDHENDEDQKIMHAKELEIYEMTCKFLEIKDLIHAF